MYSVGQAGQGGPGAGVAFADRIGTYTIAGGGTLLQGQPLCRDVTQLSGLASTSAGGAPAANVPVSGGQSDMLVLPTSANAGDLFGIYQGPTIVNPSATLTMTVAVRCRVRGYGVVQAGALAAGTAVTVGAALIISSANTFATVGARAIGVSVGKAIATVVAGVLVSAPAGSIIAVPGSGSTIVLILADLSVL